MKLSCLLLFAIPERFAKYFIIYHIYLIWHSVSNKPPISSTPILTTKHGLLPSLYSDDRFWPQWICWATNHSFFSNHGSEGHHGFMPSYMEGLFSYLWFLRKREAAGIIHNYVQFKYIWRICDCMHVFIM